MTRLLAACGLAATALLTNVCPVIAAPPAYTLVGSYPAPGPTFDVAPDGRIYALSGNAILRQIDVNGPAFHQVAQLPAGSINAFGASFIRFSPDGHHLAIGDGNFTSSAAVYIVNADPLDTAATSAAPASIVSTISSPNFDAAWNSSSELFITGARSTDFVPLVNRVDITSPSAPTVATVITDVGLASGGVALRSGNLYIGSGFLPTGEVRRFDLGALTPSSPAPFASGSLIGSYLSASPLAFDNVGNLLAGGGDTFSGTSETGYAAVVDLADPSNFLRLSPAGPTASYSVNFNHATNELLVFDSLNNTVHRYAVPAAPTAGLLGLGVLFVSRRRRA